MCGHHNINVTVAAYGVLNGQNYNIFPLVHSLHSFIEWLYETIICSIAYYIYRRLKRKAVVTEATKCKSLQTNWRVSGSTGKRSTVCKENI